MIEVLLCGVGGQGTVLAAKVLAQAAQTKGWQVRTAETIGMAQRGGSVVSHIRMGNRGERVAAPLLAHGSADLIVAFEPAEGARALPYLSDEGLLVTARTGIQPITSSLSAHPYDPAALVAELSAKLPRLVVVDDERLCAQAGSRKALNMVLLAAAIAACAEGGGPLAGFIGIDELKSAVAACVKERFVAMNFAAVDATVASFADRAGKGLPKSS